MHRHILALVLYAISFSGVVVNAAAPADLRTGIPGKSTPPRLQEVWLRFHESNLCQEVDAVFEFEANRMEVWSRADNEKSALKIRQLLEPLAGSHRVTLYSVPALIEKKSRIENDPPPSLWQNYELRFNLGDSVARTLRHLDFEDGLVSDPSLNNAILKQRLQIYAEQTLNRNKKMERYALDIMDLIRMASDPDVAPGMRSKAAEVGIKHVRNLDSLIGKMIASLTLAIPGPYKGGMPDSRTPVPDIHGKTPLEMAWGVDLHARDLVRRIYRFIYPEDFTVDVDELRNSTLLESLRTLQITVRDFKGTLAKSSWK